MSTANPTSSSIPLQPETIEQQPANQTKSLADVRLWPAVIIVLAFWVFYVAVEFAEMSMGFRFISRFGFFGVILLAYFVWWLAASRASWKDRWQVLAATIVAAIAAGLLADKKSLGSMSIGGVFLAAFPFALTTSTLWIAACKFFLRNLSPPAQRLGLCLAIFAAFGFFDLVRWEGLSGNQRSSFSWRWTPTAEEKFLASHVLQSETSPSASPSLYLQAGDWPEFRGPQRDSQVHGLKLATDWNSRPPVQLWRHRIGPAWSSMIIVDGKLFTQEQRGEQEAVVCYDAATGQEQWAHLNAARFFEPLSGAGPRATPTFAGGRIYALGGTGQLNCLDAASGALLWTRDVAKDADAEVAPGGFGLRQWGYSNSPLVVDDKVIVFAGGEHNKNVIAYRTGKGEKAWDFTCGTDGYSSPQLISLGGRQQVIIDSNKGLAAVDPTDGKQLWNHPVTTAMFLPITQPQWVGDGALLAQSENGVQLVSLAQNNKGWSATQKWESKSLKPSLNDYVVSGGNIYGFDDGVFCCLDLETGKRLWKAGRYGHGQVLLIADQPLLLVMTEAGEAVLVAPNATKLDELARCKIIEGKTWNHPVVAHGRLYARNAEEMACYELPLEK